MDYGRGKMRMNAEGDRLSSLPDDLIHKVLSFRPIKDAIGTSVLSPRWRSIWTTMPYLNFTSEDFSTLPDFSKFVTYVLSGRNNLTEVYSVKLGFRGKASQVFVKRILNYAFSHNIQQLNVVCLLEDNIDFPLSLFSSVSLNSLKHLSLSAESKQRSHRRDVICHSYYITPTSTWELPTLTALDLHDVTLCDDEADKCIGIFSKCVNLKNLKLKRFKTKGSNSFNIFHPRLSNLTLEHGYYLKVVNVVAPQLQNLTIRFCQADYVISAPHLASLFFKDYRPLYLSTNGLNSLKKADICVSHPQVADAHQITCLVQQLHNVHFLTLNMEIVEILSSSMDPILRQPSPFVNLKSVKIYQETLSMQAYTKVIMSTKLKSYLLDGSPGSTFTMVLREEVQAQNAMAELRVLLKKVKDNSKANRDHQERWKTHAESREAKKQKTEGNIAHMKSCWENLGVKIERACFIFSKLQCIEELLAKLPASNRAKIQPCFSSLCAEANIAISKLTDCVKIQCDDNQRRSSVCFHELATALEPSS